MKNKCAIIIAISMFLGLFAIPGSLFASTASNREIGDTNILKNFPYINQVDDLPDETMGLENPEDQSAPPKAEHKPPHYYGEYACGPTTIGMIFSYYGLLPKDKPASYYVAPPEGFVSNNVNYTKSRFIYVGKEMSKKYVYGIWGKTQCNDERNKDDNNDDLGCLEKDKTQYYGMDPDKRDQLLKDNNLDNIRLDLTKATVSEVQGFIKKAINNKHPVIWKITGHYLVCIGYEISNGQFRYIINDPYPWKRNPPRVQKLVTYDQILAYPTLQSHECLIEVIGNVKNPIPVIVSPKNDEPAKNNVTLSWQKVDGAMSYYVEICNAAQATNKSGSGRYANPIYSYVTSDNSHMVNKQLAPNNKYYWHVCVAESANDAKDFSMDGSFHVIDDNEILHPPKSESPKDNSIIEIDGKKDNVTLRVNDFMNNQKAAAYEFEWSTSKIYWGWPMGSKAKTSSGKKEFSIEVSANKKYYWHARALTANGTSGSWSEPIFQFEVKEKVVADCSTNPPTNVSAKENCNVPKEIALYWTHPQTNQNCPSIRDYKIETFENDKSLKLTTYKINDPIPYRISGNTGSKYHFKIWAVYNDSKVSQIIKSNEIICGDSCKECNEQPGDVTNLNGTQQGKSIRFTWSEPRFVKPSCKTRSYKLRISQDNKPFITLPDCQIETFEYTSNLVSGSSYVLEVKPVNSFGEGKATLSNPIKYSFDCTPTKPGKPSGIVDCSKKQIKFAWIPSAVDTSLGCGKVTRYKVIVKIDDTSTEEYVTDQFYFVNTIKNGQQCKIMVTPVIDQDVYKEKASEWSDAIVFDCECDHPQPVNLRDSFSTSPKEVIFEWDAPKPKKHGCAGPISYMVKYTFHFTNKNPMYNNPVNTYNRTYLKIQAERGVKYEFFVTAIYADGEDSGYVRYNKLVEYSPDCYFSVLPQTTVVPVKVGDTNERYVDLTIDGKADSVNLEGYQEFDSLSTEFFDISPKAVKAPGTARLKIKPGAFTKARDYRILFKASGCQNDPVKRYVTLSVSGSAIVGPSPRIVAEVKKECTVSLTWVPSPTSQVSYKVVRSRNASVIEKEICNTSNLICEDRQPEKGVTYYYAVIAYDKTTNTESTATWSIPVVVSANCGKQETCDAVITSLTPTTATKHPSNPILFTLITNVPVSSVVFTLYKPGGATAIDNLYFEKVTEKEWKQKIVLNATGQWRFEFIIRCLNGNPTTIYRNITVDSEVPDCKPTKPGTPKGQADYNKKTLTFTWAASSVASGCCAVQTYKWKYSLNGTRIGDEFDTNGNTYCYWPSLSSAAKGTYCVWVKAVDCNGKESDWSDVGCFDYQPLDNPRNDCKPNAPTINEPKLDCQQKIVKFSWSKPATPTGCSEVNNYEISLSINGQIPRIYKMNALSEQFTDVTNGTEFNFKVRAISADGTSDYATKTFKVDCSSPNPNAQAPQLVKPAYKTILEDDRMPNNLVLEWMKPSNWNDTMEYIVEISKWDSTIGGLKQIFKLTFAMDKEDVQIRPYDETNAITNTKGFSLEYDTKYYWHVASRFTAGNKTKAEWSSMWEFTTPSKTPALTAPGNSNQNNNAICLNAHGIANRPFKINQFVRSAWKTMACPDNISIAYHLESGLCLQDFVSDKKRWRIG